MAPQRTAQQTAAGKLISAIQKEWTAELGEPCADLSEQVMNRSHDLLQAAKAGTVRESLQGQTVAQFLGQSWAMQHVRVLPSITSFEASLP